MKIYRTIDLNNRTINLFRKYPLNTLQVTLDGRQERHNSIRMTRNGLFTYERIIKNIDLVLDELTNTQVHIRVNVEKTNMDDYFIIAEELNDRWKGKNFIVYPGFLRIDNESRTAYTCNSLNRKEIAEFMFDVEKRKVLDFSLYPQTCCAKTCSATRKTAYIVGPEGEIYKCWNDVSNSQKVVGNIHANKITNKLLLNKYVVGSKWYHDSACRNCFFLSICGGACAWYALRNKYENGKYDLCTCVQKAPGMLDKCLEQFYDMQVMSND